MIAPALLLALCPVGDVHVDEVRGFRIEIPDGWTKAEQDAGGTFALSLQPPESGGLVAVTVQVIEVQATDVGEVLGSALARIEQGGDDYADLREWESEIAGRRAPSIGVRYTAPTGEFRIVQTYLLDKGRAFVLQRHAPADVFKEHEVELETVVATFDLVEISDEGHAERRLAELAGRCGSEVRWAGSWDEAVTRARAEQRLILVSAFLLPGFSITDTPRTTIFMDEDVIELVNERFVPLWYSRGMEAAFVESYGLGPLSFGQALLLVTPEGEVVLETQEANTPEVSYEFLRAGLARNPGFAGTPPPSGSEGLSKLALARRHVARGELEEADELLEGAGSGKAHRLRARTLRLRRRGAEALAELAAARKAGGVPEAELLIEEAELLAREERVAEANERLERVILLFAGSEDAAEATLLRGLLDLYARDLEAARRRWQVLVETQPDSRWAWQAAAALRSTVLSLDVRPELDWPDEGVVAEVLVFPESAPLALGRVDEAVDAGLAWLLAAQRPDGSWITPSELSMSEELGPEPFVDAITALCVRALLRHVERDGVRESLERAVDFLLASIARREQTPPRVFFMDYNTWSDGAMLHALAAALSAGVVEDKRVRPAAGALVADLGARQVSDGGWSYYVTSDLEAAAAAAAPSRSISFTTAAVVLGLVRAREVGLSVPDEVFDPAVAALERMRDDEGVFGYFLSPEPSAATPGDVGRGPACELALLRADRSNPPRLRGAIDLFLEQAHLYSAEQGKVVMHAGPHGQGCHYLLFDYAHAALAQERLPDDGRTRAKVFELVLDCRQPDGSFVDTPLMGRAYGTAMALLALDALAEDG